MCHVYEPSWLSLQYWSIKALNWRWAASCWTDPSFYNELLFLQEKDSNLSYVNLCLIIEVKCFFFYSIFLTFFPLNRDSTSSEEMWETQQHFWKQISSYLCSQIKWAFFNYSCIILAGRRKLFPSAHVILIPAKEGLQNHHRSCSIGKDLPVGVFLKDKPFRNTPHFSGVVATHITSSFKRQNENMTIREAWKQMSYYYFCVLDTLTSAELRKSESNKGTNCKGIYCGLPVCSCWISWITPRMPETSWSPSVGQ